MFSRLALISTIVASLLAFAVVGSIPAAEETPIISVAEGNITMKAPAEWEKKDPRVRIIEAELSVPPVEGDKDEGRCTIMGAGGSVQANIDRWIGQFTSTTRNKTEKKTIADQEVHVVDLAGTYKDQRGPFAPAVLRKEYRMLGAIIVTQNRGQYFVKFYGPQATVSANEKAFQAMLDSLQVK